MYYLSHKYASCREIHRPNHSRRQETTTNFPTPLNCVTDIRIIQKHENIARGVTNMKSLLSQTQELELSLQRFMLNLTAASKEPLAPSVITLSSTSVADAGSAGLTESVGAELDDLDSAGGFDGAVSDVGSRTSALLSFWFSANRTLFNTRPVRVSPSRLAAARKRAFPTSVFLSSPSTRIRHSSVWLVHSHHVSMLCNPGSDPTSRAP